MRTEISSDDEGLPKKRALLIVVGVGMALFVSGFILAVTSLSEPVQVSADADRLQAPEADYSQSSSVSLLLGSLLSLSGVVMATAGPAVFFIHARRECT